MASEHTGTSAAFAEAGEEPASSFGTQPGGPVHPPQLLGSLCRMGAEWSNVTSAALVQGKEKIRPDRGTAAQKRHFPANWDQCLVVQRGFREKAKFVL